MKLALLGADQDSLNLVRWAVDSGGHQLAAAYDSEAHAHALRAIAPQVRLNESWEELFLASVADAVIIGRGGKEAAARANIDPAERRADQLRKLVQAAVPMIVVCPACEAIVGFEIDMIRRDTKAIMIPYVPIGSHSLIDQISKCLIQDAESPIGTLQQIVLEREQTDRSREAVLFRLARDVSLLRKFIGTIQTVSATGPPMAIGRDPLGPKSRELPSLANLSVHFGGNDGISARWSIAPAMQHDQGRLTVVGERGKATLTMPAFGDWSLQMPGVPPITKPADLSDDAQQVFSSLAGAMVRGEFYNAEAWLAACRDQEAAEAVDRSLARGRTIELFNEEHTEEESFKGVMAMGGCLLLLIALGLVFVVVLGESLQLPVREWRVWRLWPIYLLVPIVAFLLLQFLQLAVKRNK